MTYCKQCLQKQQKINELQEQIASLKDKLRYQQRTAQEGFFGSSTPSSKLPVKSNSSTEHQRNRGGGKPGHKGHGRESICEQDADQVQRLCIGNVCPDCGSALQEKGTRARTVIDCQPVKMKKIVYHLERKRCPKCKKLISARPAGVLACPYQENAPICKNKQFKFYSDRAKLNLQEVLNLSSESFNSKFADSPIKRLGLEGLRRNARICLANINGTNLSRTTLIPPFFSLPCTFCLPTSGRLNTIID